MYYELFINILQYTSTACCIMNMSCCTFNKRCAQPLFCTCKMAERQMLLQSHSVKSMQSHFDGDILDLDLTIFRDLYDVCRCVL